MEIFAFQNHADAYQWFKLYFECKNYESKFTWSDSLKYQRYDVAGSQVQICFSNTGNKCNRAYSVGTESFIIHSFSMEM